MKVLCGVLPHTPEPAKSIHASRASPVRHQRKASRYVAKVIDPGTTGMQSTVHIFRLNLQFEYSDPPCPRTNLDPRAAATEYSLHRDCATLNAIDIEHIKSQGTTQRKGRQLSRPSHTRPFESLTLFNTDPEAEPRQSELRTLASSRVLISSQRRGFVRSWPAGAI